MFQTNEPAYAKLADADRQTIERAIALLQTLIVGEVLDHPEVVKNYLTLRYADLEHEVFGALWLNSRNRLISEEVLFRGTLTQTSVYPREVAKQGLRCNACSVVVFHNHPGKCSEPSTADNVLTATLRQSLALVDIRLLDHIVVSAGGAVSFAERGEL